MRSALFSLMLSVWVIGPVSAVELVSGTYVEARTCQVYTGPCFANGEVGSVGKNAIMTWRIVDGRFVDVDLSGLSVAVVVKTSHTLGFNGLDDARSRKAIVIVDTSASAQQALALRSFVTAQTGLSGTDIVSVHRSVIDMQFNVVDVTATVDVGEFAHLEMRKARRGDCICSNESAYYPPLTKLKGFVPGVTIEGDVTARGLGTRWSIPDSRTAYLGTFEVDAAAVQLAGR